MACSSSIIRNGLPSEGGLELAGVAGYQSAVGCSKNKQHQAPSRCEMTLIVNYFGNILKCWRVYSVDFEINLF